MLMHTRYSRLILWLLLLGSSTAAWAQAQRHITGTVRTAEKSEALPGVTVLVKGTTNGATTNVEGQFDLTVPANEKVTLRFSFISYATKEVAVSATQTSVDVKLEDDSKQLDDVVVIGYAAVQRRDVTGSVSSVNAQQIKDIPVNSAAEALSGRLAGVQLTSADGSPGNQNFQVRVRGGGSITQDNSPLYIVDGVQVENALSVISPQDIASVDVLKDASATAIYGARGANGVVIITTKSGKEGKVTVTYNGFAGFRRIVKKLPVMDPSHFVDFQYERALAIGNAPNGISTFTKSFGSFNFNGDTLNASRNAPFINWQNEAFGRDAFQQTHNLSIAGGTKGTTYSLSVTRNKEDGIQLGSDYVRNLVNLRLDNKASDRFKLGVSIRFNDQQTNGAGTGTATTGGTNTTSRLRNAVQFQPLAVPFPFAFDPNEFDPEFFESSSLVSPVLVINNEKRADKRRTLNMGGNASFNITKNLVFRSTLGVDLTTTAVETFNGLYSPTIRRASGPYKAHPFASITNGTQTTINQSNVLSYNLKKGVHSFDALIGQEIYQQRNTTLNIETAFLPDNITYERAIANINQAVFPTGVVAQPTPVSTSVPQDYRLLSGFGRLNYNYDERYLFTGTFRVDGSSKFASGNRVGVFPAASVAWRISRESFMKDITAVSDLKLRLSYGLAGNNRINDFQTYQTFQAGNSPYYLNDVQVLGTAATALPNPNLKWETTVSRNVGVDISVLNNRVQLSADVYYNSTRDLLLPLPVPGFIGYTSQLVNIGRTSNRGLELQATTTVLRNENFNWTASANISFNRSRIEDLGGPPEIPGLTSGWANTITQDYVARIDGQVGQMYGYITDGFYTASDFSDYNPSTRAGTLKPGIANDGGTIGQPVGPGIIKLKDISGPNGVPDGIVDSYDRTVIGNSNPKFTGGFNQQFTYKNFDASVFLNFVYGNNIYNANKIEFTTSFYPMANLLSIMNDRYTTINAQGQQLTTLESLDAANQNAKIWQPTKQYFFHSWAVEDGSFLRVNNITVGYTLPRTLLQRVKLTQLRFYATVNNVYTFTKYTGFDPEVNTRRNTPLTPGVDYAAYPRSRAFLFGLNLSI